MMDQIFGHASRVWIWLGEPPIGGCLPIDLMALVRTEIYVPRFIEHNLAARARILSMSNEVLKSRFGIPHTESEAWRQARLLVTNPWFSRVWVFQELIVAKEAYVLYGQDRVPFTTHDPFGIHGSLCLDSFWRALEALDGRHLPSETAPQYLSNTVPLSMAEAWSRSRRNYAISQQRLSALLKIRRHCLATDPRDQVYALLNVAVDNEKLGISPNYTLPYEEVYTRTARAIIQSDQSLAIMQYTRAHGQNRILPSWVPDWNCKTRFPQDASGDGRLYHATKTSQPIIQEIGHSSFLILGGSMLDKITNVGSPSNSKSQEGCRGILTDGGE